MRTSQSALAGTRHRFHGRELSAATGLVHFRARWYDPAVGRWISKDPIRLHGGLNLYAFCADDPVNFTDRFGLCKKKTEEEEGEEDSSESVEESTLGEQILNAANAANAAVQSAVIPTATGTAVSALEGVPGFIFTFDSAKAYAEVIESITDGAVETNDKGGVLQSNERRIQRNGRVVDSVTNR